MNAVAPGTPAAGQQNGAPMLYFLGFFTPEKPSSEPPTPEHMETMHRLIRQATEEGWLVQTGPILRGPNNVCIRLADGSFTVTDAAERREVGYALLRARSREEIVEKTKLFLSATGGGETELFEIMAPPPACSGAATNP